MAFGTPVVGGTSYSGTSGGALNTVTPSYPSGITDTDQLVLFVGQKPATANGGGITDPDGWTIRDSLTGAGGYGNTLGQDTGNTNLYVYTKDVVTGDETGNLSVALTNNNVAWAFIVRIPTGGGDITYGASDGSDTTAGNVSVTLAANPGLTAGDIAIWAMCIPTDVTTPNQFSAHAITATGATFDTPTELNEPDSGTNNDIGGFSAYTDVLTGTASAAPTITATAGGTNTNVRGPLVFLRLRETIVERIGSLDATETGSDTFAASGTVAFPARSGSLAATETGADTFAASGTVAFAAITGSLAATETGTDTFSASGTVAWEPISGLFAATETGTDTLASTGIVLVAGALAATETGSDTFAATGTVTWQEIVGALSATEAGDDAFAATGAVLVSGALAITEVGLDVFAGSGGTTENAIVGSLTAHEEGDDTFAATAKAIASGALAVSEQGADTFAATGALLIQGALTATESGQDALAATGTVLVSGALEATEQGSDAFAASAKLLVAGTLAATEAGDDTFTAFGGNVLVGALDATETSTDTASASGTVTWTPITGAVNATEAADSTGQYVEPGYVESGYFGTGWSGKVLISGAASATESGNDTFYAFNVLPAPPQPQPRVGGGGDAPAKTSRYSDPTAYDRDRIRERLTVKIGNKEFDVFDPTLVDRIEELAAEPEPEAPTELERQERKLARSFTVKSGDRSIEVPMFRPMLAELPDLKTAMMADIEAFAAKARSAADDERRRIVLLLMAAGD